MGRNIVNMSEISYPDPLKNIYIYSEFNLVSLLLFYFLDQVLLQFLS